MHGRPCITQMAQPRHISDSCGEAALWATAQSVVVNSLKKHPPGTLRKRIRLSLSLSLSLCLSVSVSVSLSLCLSVSVSLCLSVSVSISLPLSLSLSLLLSLCVCVCVCMNETVEIVNMCKDARIVSVR